MAFQAPNYTQVPNVVVDELMAKLSSLEFKCMMLIIRKTFGYHRRRTPISLTEFMNRTNGSRQGVINSVESIEKQGWVIIHRPGNRTDCNEYELDIEDICSKLVNSVDQLSTKGDEVVNSLDQGSQLSLPGVVNSVDSSKKQSKKRIKEKDSVGTLPSSIKRKEKDFTRYLNPEQKAAYEKVMLHKPQWGEALDPNDVCAWLKDPRFGSSRVLEVLAVYRQDCDEAVRRGDTVRSMGASMRASLNKGRKPTRDDAKMNREMAERKAKQHRFLEVTKKYLKVRSGNLAEEISFDIPHTNFLTQLENYIRKATLYSETYA